MADSLKKEHRIFTYSDYSSWSDDKRWEIIGGPMAFTLVKMRKNTR